MAVGLVAALLPLMGCGSEGGSDADGQAPADAITDVPPIHVEQTVVVMQDGRPMREQLYRQAAAGCAQAVRQAPQFAFKPLSESEIAKVGRTYWTLWFHGKQSAARYDTWDYTVGQGVRDGCVFSLTHKAGISLDDGEHRYQVDPLTGKTEEDSAPSSGGRMKVDDDEQLTSQQAKEGWQRPGEATAAGQQCLQWRSPDGTESCAWSGGRKWGFSPAEGSDQATSYDPGRIVLWVKPANGTGGELTTRSMTVGQPFDDSVFKAPADSGASGGS